MNESPNYSPVSSSNHVPPQQSRPAVITGATEPQPQQNSEHAMSSVGLVDVVEAFVAMKQEWRGQSREDRALVEVVQQSIENLAQLESRFSERLASISDGTVGEVSRGLVEALVEIDLSLSRALTAMSDWQARTAQDFTTLRTALSTVYRRRWFFSRWLHRSFFAELEQQLDAQLTPLQGRVVQANCDGVQLVYSRLQRLMEQQSIVRSDTVGKPFDPHWMNAIGSVETQQQPSGHVVEQVSPVYIWQGRLLRYAEVRVAK